MPSKTTFSISIPDLLSFYDHQNEGEGQNASALTGLFGEELSLGLLCHNLGQGWENTGLIPKNGKWLDGWIINKEQQKAYQVEVKNWSSYSKGGKRLRIDASQDEIKKVAYNYFKSQWDSENKQLKSDSVRKVLHTYSLPSNYNGFSVQPVICYWHPISNQDINNEGLFSVEIESEHFQSLTFFSCSLYLRHISQSISQKIELQMPILGSRLSLISRIFR